ncbi:MAG: ribosome small subunit-dependent GTPase A [Deltaproteobacteria bacterium]|nr:ribosome small subunit-dependent GTPase A [Deltaproteobacteria bacterium]
MDKITNGIKALGFGKWFQDNAGPVDLEGLDIARVIAVHKESYILNDGENDVSAELIGKLLFSAASPIDLPTVGDWVLAAFYDKGTFSIIHDVLPRKSLLKRKTPGKRVDFQLIAANIDVAFIVQSLDTDFNLRRLERYLVMVKDSHIEPIILLSKSDLLKTKDINDRVAEIHNIMPFLHVLPFSNEKETGLKDVRDLLAPQKTYCLLGSSGVGKTTLLNRLIGDAVFTTRTVREKDSKGRHVTTYRQLIKLECGAMLIDNPGIRELGGFSVETGIDGTFTEIVELSELCQFNDCTHVNEKGCAVLKAVKNGQISEERYQNYIKMKKESDYYEMSYFEKRKRDKQFGKLIKTLMKHKKEQR